MIGQLVTLLRVKELKRDQAFRAMRAKAAEVDEAKAATRHAQAVVDESASTLAAREDAIYAAVLGQVIDLDGVDRVRGKVVALERDHQALKDDLDRAAHVEARLAGELVTLTDQYRQCERTCDKYIVITDEMKRELEAFGERREEGEVEDLFGRGNRRLS